ncbi:MAG: replication-associated recombination protein A [Firmicutes bacterium]|nr:replication-associated recombination protein A [Bacillota bacterium]
MDLFSGREQEKMPLASRMRPRTLEEFVGQEEIVGPGRLLRHAIETDRLTSMILYGPPGTGKTTLARIIASTTRAHFEQINAVTAGVADLRRIIAEARERLKLHDRRTVLFIDEIHRFNKAQQDALLAAVEEGTILLIGATTENPFFTVNSPLVSRARLFQLRPLKDEEIGVIIDRALADPERGLGGLKVELEEKARRHLIEAAAGDARVALNGLELAAQATEPDEDGVRRITLATVEDALQQRAILYDRDGQGHYDAISAFIKSMRGSDPDAAVYWLARMLAAGEDPRFIARRMVIHAAEDVGNADPHALLLAVAAAQAVEFVGLPEAQIPMAQAAIYIACAPKSNAVVQAIGEAMEDARRLRAYDVPDHLKNPPHERAARILDHGLGYKYPHDFPGGYVPQQYLPEPLLGKRYYRPKGEGYEARLKDRMERLGIWPREEEETK